MNVFGLTFAALCRREALCGTKPSTKTSTKHKRADLQGLRGIAILFVLVMHLNPNSYRLGFVGVDIFFVLSGFLMAKILLERKLTWWSVWSFYNRRFKRIVPLYMLFVVSVYIYGHFYVLRFDRKQILDDLTWAYTYSSNLQPIFQKLGYWDQLSTYRFFVHAWSLGVELQYYLIVPIIMGIAFCCGRNIRILLFLSIGLFSLIFQLYSPPKISYGFLLSRVWQFMCGSLAYELSKPSFVKGKPLLPQKEEGSSRNACNQDTINLSYKDSEEGGTAETSICRINTVVPILANQLKQTNQVILNNAKIYRQSSMENHETFNLILSNTDFFGGSLFTNILVLVMVVSIVISPKSISDNTARICSTLVAGLLVYLSTDAFCLTNGFIVYCGDISYVLYLAHWPIIAAARYSVDSQTLSSKGVATVLSASFMLSIAVHHTLEKLFEKKGVITACLCVIICYACILSTKSKYIYAPPLESINPNISKIDYAIEWNMRESRKVYYAMPCRKDDTQRYTNYKKWPQMRCVAKGNATAKVLMLGNSIAYRAYPLIHDILKGRYRSFRLYSRSACPPLSNWCPDFAEATRKVVQREKPDIILYMHLSVYAPFVAPVKDLKNDRIYKEFQKNIDFISNYTKHIVIDMPYYKPSFNVGAKLARRLQLGLSPGDEFVVTWQQHINQTQYHQLRLSSLNCSKCIMNEINEALFKDGLFYLYDPDTLLARNGDGIHLTPVGLELLRPLYTKILENLLQTLTN